MGLIEKFIARYRKEYDFYDQAARLLAQKWPRLFGQNVLFLKWCLAVFCLCGGEPCGQVVNIHSIRRVSVKRPVRPDLVVERQVTLQTLVGGADGLVGV